MKIVAIAQARMGSTRFPGKVMKVLGRKPVLRWTIDTLRTVPEIDEVVLATSDLEADNVIADYCSANRLHCFRGSEADVLDRFYQCAKEYKADVVLRLTCDCPFLDQNVISEVIRLYKSGDYYYASNIDPPSYPDGLDVECFSVAALSAAWREATRPSDRDCVPQFIVRNRHRFRSANLRCPLPGLEKERWVLDTEDDFQLCTAIAEHLDTEHPSYLDILRVLDRHPELRQLNSAGVRNERFYQAISTEPLPERRFDRSEEQFRIASKLIPFGAQTFSKSHLQFPPGAAPLYVSHADGAHIFDIDGNDYIDLVNAVLPVVLGYRDPDVDAAIRKQLDNGISFSLATELETELSDLLRWHIPCAEMVKFGKTGTDVTTAAIRLARAYTGRERVILSGYHGWADWSMAPTDRSLGIPEAVKQNSAQLEYGRYSQFNNHLKGDVAAVIVEPETDPEFLKWLRERCDAVGAVLIFDEVITGFRWSLGGAQRLYNVIPDLACFGKAMANGMPISALVGKQHIMKGMAPPNNIFYSGTMFGETLSITAAIATINKLAKSDVISHLWSIGSNLCSGAESMMGAYDLCDVIKLGGKAPRVTISFVDQKSATANQLRTLFMQEMIQGGVLVIGSHNVSYAIGEPEMARIFSAYDRALGKIAQALARGNIKDMIKQEAATVAPLRAAS